MKHELLNTPLDDAIVFANSQWPAQGIENVLPSFSGHYVLAQTMTLAGIWARHEMPVIEEEDFPALKALVEDHDKSECEFKTFKACHLVPLQRQIFLDNSISSMAKEGLDECRAFLTKKHICVTKDGHIIDGHHRWLSALLIDPEFQLPVFVIEEETIAALKASLELSDKEGHARNG